MRTELVVAAVFAGALALDAGCGERGASPEPPSERAAEPAAPPAPHERGTEPGRAASGDPRCLALCEHSAACLASRGEPLGEDERDCAESCRGGLYGAIPELVLGCSAHTDCTALAACTSTALESLLDARSPDVSPPSPAPEQPASWPESFPTIPGGTPLPIAVGDPLTLARVAYPGLPEGVESLFRDELTRQGWELDPTTADDGAVRFFARRHGTEVGVAIYPDGSGRSVVQLFGFAVERTTP